MALYARETCVKITPLTKEKSMQSFKEFEHQAWLEAVDQYDASFSSLTKQIIPAILHALDLRQNSTFLDVACGPGYLAGAGKNLGAESRGVDFSSSMVARAKKLHPDIEFDEGDAEDLRNYPNGCFDAVAMNFGIIHLGKPENALKAAHRVLKKGGRMAFTSWCNPKEAVGFSLVYQAIQKFGNPNIELPEAPPLFYFSEKENCKQALLQCGFSHTKIELVQQTWELHSLDELFQAFFKGTARTAGLLKKQSQEQLEEIRNALQTSVSSYVQQGKITIPMPALVASGCKSL